MARTDQPHKLTFDAFVAKSANLEDPINAKHASSDYSRPETRAAWNGSKSKIPIWCTVHEEFYVQQAANHMNGQGCPKCGVELRTDKKRKKDPIGAFRAKHGDIYDYSKVVYENNHTRVTIVCPAHGPFTQKPLNHLLGEGCPACWENRRKAFGKVRNEDYRESFAERAARIHKGAYSILKLPEGAHDTVLLNCPTHGDFEQKAYSHLDGHGCWGCGQATSGAEQAVADFVTNLGVVVERENRTILGGGLHIDIWVPSHQTGIEYHGSYWHTEERIGSKHREKWERAEAAGIRLIQVFDFEWLENPYAVEERLRAMFAPTKALAPRDCDRREVTRSDANAFFDKVHTQGRGSNLDVAYGLFHEGELVACASFAQLRTGDKEGWEVLRFATKGRVHGAFSKLLKKFISDNEPEKVTSFCDLRWGNGKVYGNAGFVLDGVTRPDYWYYLSESTKRISRHTAMRRPKGQTEREWAAEHNYKKVLGVGHQRWVWRKPEGEQPQ